MINVFQVHSGIPLLSLSLMKDECTNYVLWKNTSTWMDKNAKFVYRCDSDVIASVRKVSDGCKPRKQFSYFKSFFSEIKVSWGNYAEESYYHLPFTIADRKQNCQKSRVDIYFVNGFRSYANTIFNKLLSANSVWCYSFI